MRCIPLLSTDRLNEVGTEASELHWDGSKSIISGT